MATASTHPDHHGAPRWHHRRVCNAWSLVAESRRMQILLIASIAFGFIAFDAATRFPGRADIETMKFVQRLHFDLLHTWMDLLGLLTDSSGAVVAWGITLAVFALLRWWVPLVGAMVIPVGGVVNETISRVLIHRTRPHLEELRHVSQNFEERSFPSGHVVGAILLYGFIWYVVGDRIHFAPLRRGIRAVCGAIVLLSGFDRIWSGAHWPSDVAGAYTLGTALLLLLIIFCEWIEREAAKLRQDDGAFASWFPATTGAALTGTAGPTGRARMPIAMLRPLVLKLAPPDGSQPEGTPP